MSKDVLYYPTIDFRREDFNWLWVSSLLWDRVYRIVPDDYALDEPRNIQELCSTGEIGIALSPSRYRKKSSDDFRANIESKKWGAAAFFSNTEDLDKYQEYCRIHKDKVDVVLQNMMLLQDNTYEDKDWLYTGKALATLFMTYLATEIATQNNLALSTGDSNIWVASSYYLYDAQLQPCFLSGDEYEEESRSTLALTSLLLKNLIPENIMHLTPSQILEFRKKRKDERTQFHSAIDEFGRKLSEVSDPRILKIVVDEELGKVEKAINEYKKSMDMFRVSKWMGGISQLITVLSNAFYITNNVTGATIAASVGANLGLIAGLKKEPKSTPYLYLYELKKLTEHGVSEIYKNLINGIEEFIDD